ncbi:unnamed protein product, partial [Mesorhabditis spiculigera]
MFEDDDFDDFFGEEAIEDNREQNKETSVANLFDEEKQADDAQKPERKKRTMGPKFNEALLTGPKGVRNLVALTKDFKPNPKADPYANLNLLLQKYRHWAHVMCPQKKFEDVIQHCEKLSNKRAIQVHMIRLNQESRGIFVEEGDENIKPSAGKKKKEKDTDGWSDDDWDAAPGSTVQKSPEKQATRSSSPSESEGSVASNSDNGDVDDIFDNGVSPKKKKRSKKSKKTSEKMDKSKATDSQRKSPSFDGFDTSIAEPSSQVSPEEKQNKVHPPKRARLIDSSDDEPEPAREWIPEENSPKPAQPKRAVVVSSDEEPAEDDEAFDAESALDELGM